ncbi:hypothetical protein HBDW_47160 [Herbaspirillum sp. DW155]|uniref:hypothetical protein n=1 Tax=Herbaspirillum sp. DW155 TaxID=3095609 RepID=UPI00308FD5BE|nr:hypothetical protein HBDW_47160 [Herbaspirillum sp. DW155]
MQANRQSNSEHSANERVGEHPDDPARQRLRKSLGGGRTPPVERPPRQMRPAAQAPSASTGARHGNIQPVVKQAQHEEYTQPLRVSQRQWT